MANDQIKLSVFNSISLDGYFTDPDNDMSWAHARTGDQEWNDFVSENAGGNGELLFGRITYQMMESFWTTPAAAQMMPKVAEGMSSMRKIVFSETLDEVSWNNTTLIKTDLIGEVKKLKEIPGKNITILGSGTIVAQLTAADLIDSYSVVVVPVVLGAGRTMFDGVTKKLDLKLFSSRIFKNGNVLLTYSV